MYVLSICKYILMDVCIIFYVCLYIYAIIYISKLYIYVYPAEEVMPV